MNDQPSPVARVEDDTPPSPKRKKVRAKYAPKACVSCRRSKLKCSGENPCQRCLDNGKRCFYSEDQTAAETLQNLSRPPPVQPPLAAPGTNGSANPRRSILPRHEIIERRASDASVLGLSMEARMARIEGMMETLIQERTMGSTPRGSMERDDTASDIILGDAPVQAAGDIFNPSLAQARHSSFKLESPERPRLSTSGASPSSSADSNVTIRLGSKSLVFPNPADYQKYIDFFFADLNPYYPCINEADFRIRSERTLATSMIHNNDATLLALNYMVFACSDIAVDVSPQATANSKPAGWHWFQAAADALGKRELNGRGDLTFIQYLILETAFLTSADKPNAAYKVIGTACRLCFQLGLHQQSPWRNFTPFDEHMRQRIFWTTYYFDRYISLSCGRPYCIRESDIDIEQPSYLYDRDIHPDQPLPDPDLSRSSNMFLNSMVCWARLVADVWDALFAPTVAKHGVNLESALLLNARIKQWTEFVLPTIPLLPSDQPPDMRQVRQHVLIHTRLSSLRLLLFRQLMLSLKYDAEHARLCSDLAIDIVQRIRKYKSDMIQPDSFRFHMATSLGSALLILGTIVVRDLETTGLDQRWFDCADVFKEAKTLLQDLSHHHAVARRIQEDLKDILEAVQAMFTYQNQQTTQDEYSLPQHVLPANIATLFPYTELDYAQQPGGGDVVLGSNSDAAEAEDCERMGRYGVPWI